MPRLLIIATDYVRAKAFAKYCNMPYFELINSYTLSCSCFHQLYITVDNYKRIPGYRDIIRGLELQGCQRRYYPGAVHIPFEVT
jgi:hypothetical protein